MRALLMTLMVLFVATATADDRRDRLEKGEVIVVAKKDKTSKALVVKAMGLINASPEKVWAIVEKCADYKKNMPRTADSKELSRKGNKVRCEVTIDMPFPLKNVRAVTEATHTVTPGKEYKRKWKLIEGDFKQNSGSWTITPYTEGRSLAIYRVKAEPKIEIPQAIQRMAQKNTIPKIFAGIRKLTEKR